LTGASSGVLDHRLRNKEKREKINEIMKAKEGIAMASRALGTISPEQRAYFLRLSDEKYFLDTKSKRLQAKRKEKEAMAKGKAEGKAEGRAEGKAEGRAEGKAEVAQKMKLMGFSDEQIHAVTDSDNS
jgi:flagellar biosynthesis/type III secretory pathway protein FliH